MEKPRILCVAYDAAPSRAFMKMQKYSEKSSSPHAITTMTADGNPAVVYTGNIVDYIHVWKPNLMLIGMSSQPREIEMVAISEAKKIGIKYGFYGDIPRAFTRPHFQEALHDATFYMGVTPTEKEQGFAEIEAQGRCEFFATGNPLRDEFVIPMLPKKRWYTRNNFGIDHNDNVILMPGNKEVVANIIRVSEFCAYLRAKENSATKTHLWFAPHPGDTASHAVDKRDMKELQIYETLMKYQTQGNVTGSVITNRSASSLLPAVDMVVDCGSSLAIEAIYNRIPSVTWMTDEDRKSLVTSNGHSDLEVLANGCSVDGKLFAKNGTSEFSLYGISHFQYLDKMKATYPLPEIPDPYASVKKMLQVITDHLAL